MKEIRTVALAGLYTLSLFMSLVTLQNLAFAHSGNEVKVPYSDRPIFLDGMIGSAEWVDARDVSFTSANQKGNVVVALKYDSSNNWLNGFVLVSDDTWEEYDKIVMFLDMGHTDGVSLDSDDHYLWIKRGRGSLPPTMESYSISRYDSRQGRWFLTDRPFQGVFLLSMDGYQFEFRLRMYEEEARTMGFAILQQDVPSLNAPLTSSVYPKGAVFDSPQTWADLIFIKQTSILVASRTTDGKLNLGGIRLDSDSYRSLPTTLRKLQGTYTVTALPSKGYEFDHWETDGGISVSSATSITTQATINSAGSLRAVFKLGEYTLTVRTPYQNMQIELNDKTYATNTEGKIQLKLTSGSYTVRMQNMLTISAGTRVLFDKWDDGSNLNPRAISLEADTTLIAGYNIQHFLKVNTPYGSATGEGWYDADRAAAFSVTSPVDHGNQTRRVFTRWSGDSSFTTSAATITMNSPKTVNAVWRKQFQVTVNSNYGNPTGGGWYDEGGSAKISVNSPHEHSNFTRRIFLGFAGDAISSSSSLEVVADKPRTIIANWKTQYFLVVTSTYGKPQGQGWFDRGTEASFSVEPIHDHDNGTRRVFRNWSGTSSTTPSDRLLMNGPARVEATWKTQYLLKASSAYGSVSGEGWYDRDATLILSISPTVEHGNGTRRVFISWTGSSTSRDASTQVRMDSPKTMIASWRTQYYLTVASQHGEVKGSGWYDAASRASFSIFPTTIPAGALTYIVFSEWDGDFDGQSMEGSVLINGPKTVTAIWITDYSQLYLAIGAIVVVASIVGSVAVIIRRRRVRKVAV